MGNLTRLLRRLVAAGILLAAMVLPIVVFLPFVGADYISLGDPPPSTLQTFIWFGLFECFLLMLVYLIDPKKN